jgi:hypothetical protein
MLETVGYSILLVVFVITVRFVIRWLQESENKLLRMLGEIAHEEIEKTMSGEPGNEKMKAAIKKVRESLDEEKIYTSMTDSEIEAIIQEAWKKSNPDR